VLVWRLFLNGRNPFEYFDDVDLNDAESIQGFKSSAGFLTRSCQTLDTLDLNDKDSELITAVLQDTLPYNPVHRHLRRALSAFRSYHQEVTQTEPARPLPDPSMEIYEAAQHDRDHVSYSP
jgi:hypothetical protein